MAKYGEGDKRWIVEDRPDGANVHNWHWAERDCLEYSRSLLSSLLQNLTILDGEGGLRITTNTLDKLEGEAYVNIRKGKIIPGYELSLSLSFEAEVVDSVKLTGSVHIPYIADENADEDPEIRVSIRDDDGGPVGRRVKDAFIAKGNPVILEKVRVYVDAMAKGGPAKDELEVKKPKSASSTVTSTTSTTSVPKVEEKKKKEKEGFKTIKVTEKFSCRAKDMYEILMDENRWKGFTQSNAKDMYEILMDENRWKGFTLATPTSQLHDGVAAAHRFDEATLLRYAAANVAGFPSPASAFAVSQFGYGQSNPTFLLHVTAAGDGSVKRYVMRKKPPGVLLESAHAVEREFKVMEALGVHTDVPVPKVFCLCTDRNVMGTSFYIMEYLEGRIFLDPKLPGISPERRKAVYQATAKTLASLHKVNVDAIGLQKFGMRDNYCKRQVERWAKQYLASTAEGKPDRNPKMLELIAWLKNHIPLEDSLGVSSECLVHGDFRIDNLVFHPVEDKVIGILDWELSTLGNQMCDVAYSSLPYVVDLDSETPKGFEFSSTPEGIPSQADYLVEYCSTAGKPWPFEDWKFYIAFSLFRGASIYAGVYRRWILGNASGGERANYAEKRANILIDSAWEFINRKSVLPDQPPLGHAMSIVGHIKGDQTNLYPSSEQGKFVPSQKVLNLRNKLIKFMEDNIYPMEKEFYKLAQSSTRWTVHPEEEKLKELAKRESLWNLWIPIDSAARAKKLLFDGKDHVFNGVWSNQLLGAGLSNLEYGYLCEIMGRSIWAPQIFNCGAPDTGNMEVLLRYGTKEQLKEWLIPLLEGKIRSGFAMTEPQVASSDATNIECSIARQGNSYVINGKKWWTSGAMDPRCKILIVMGKTDFSAAKHKQQSMILVDISTLGVNIIRPLMVFGFDDAPHGHAEVYFENVRVPVDNILLGEGRGFEIAQGRLGPGRLHHCMRLIGMAERGMQMMVERALIRRTFGKLIAEHGSFLSDLAKRRIELEKTRLLVLEAADQLDRHGNKKARGILAMAKVAAPSMALQVLDMAMQVHGAAGLSSDTVLAHLWATARTLRIADGPDEVHLGTIAKLEIQRAKL